MRSWARPPPPPTPSRSCGASASAPWGIRSSPRAWSSRSTTIRTWAQDAYAANPSPIPYESPRYRRWADVNGDGYVAGPGELMPLYLAAARDFGQPLFAYGPPRLVRLGVEFAF